MSVALPMGGGQHSSRSPAIRFLLLLFAGWPALLLIWVILSCGVNVPVMDEWFPNMAGLFVKAHRGELAIGDFLVQHNEHRMIVPRIIFFLMGSLTHMNKVAEMVGSWVLACLMSLGILRLILQTSVNDPAPRLIDRFDGRTATLWLICNLFLFTPEGWENWLTGFGLSNVLPMALFVALVVVVTCGLKLWTRVILAVLIAMAVMWSTGNGLLAWPVAGGLLAWSDSKRQLRAKVPALFALLAAFAINVVVYGSTYRASTDPGQGQIPPAGIGQIIHHNLVFMGNAFSYVANMYLYTFATIVGLIYFVALVGCACYFFVVWLRWKDHAVAGRLLVWLSLAGVSFVTGAMASFFRAGLGVDQAASSRYFIFSMFLPIALVNLIPIICHDLTSRLGGEAKAWLTSILTPAPVFLGGIMLVLGLIALAPGLDHSQRIFRQRRGTKASLLLMNVMQDFDRLHAVLTFDPPKTVEMARALNEFGYIQPPLIASNNANLIKDNAPTQVRGRVERSWQSGVDRVSIAGWACAPGSWRAADAVLLTYDDDEGIPRIFAMAAAGEPRSDLVQKEGVGELLWAGWQLDLPFNRVPPTRGPTRVCAWVLNVDTGTVVKLDGEAMITIKRS